MKQGSFEIKGNGVNRPFLVLKDSEGKTIAISVSYSDRISCEHSITLIRETVSIAQVSHYGDGAMSPKFEIFERVPKQIYFNLHAINGAIVLSSESFARMSDCESAIEKIKEIALYAKIIDLL